MKVWRPLIFGMIFLVLVLVPALADDIQQGLDGRGEVRVVSDRMVAETLSNKVVFSGNVKATQNDVVIYAQKLTLFYVRGEKGTTKGIDRAEIEGNVRIIQQDRMATADKGLFLNRERRIVLSGQAEVHQGGNVVKGDEIIYLLEENRSIVKSAPDSRVKAVIRPKGEAP